MKTLKQVSAILITKEKEYPEKVLVHVRTFDFGEILILTECEGIYRRFMCKPQFDDIYVQDDDCITEIDRIFKEYNGRDITCGMTPHHIGFYEKSRICLIGHGAFFPWKKINVLKKYKRIFGKDSDYLIETDRIFTFLNYPQLRISVPVINLPSYVNSDRLSMRKEHAENLTKVEIKLTKYLKLLKQSPGFFNSLRFWGIWALCKLPMGKSIIQNSVNNRR